MPHFRPRISILTALLLMTILAMAIVIALLWREMVPMRAENKQLNEERGTLVLDDKQKLHAIRIPDRFAGDDRTSFRVYVPDGQLYFAYAQVNDIPKSAIPAHKPLPRPPGPLGMFQGRLYARLDPGEHVVTIRTTHYNHTADIYLVASLTNPHITLDAGANTSKDRWPTKEPEAYAVHGDSVKSTTVASDGSQPLVLMRYRVEPQEANPKVITTLHWPEPEYPLDGVILWLERTK
jgi:hypothetical protein